MEPKIFTVARMTAGTVLTQTAFRARFTQAEKVAIDLASIDNPAGTADERTRAAQIRVYLADVAAASNVDLADPVVIDGVMVLEADGLIARGRASQILAG
jgi:hypothetical protein